MEIANRSNYQTNSALAESGNEAVFHNAIYKNTSFSGQLFSTYYLCFVRILIQESRILSEIKIL